MTILEKLSRLTNPENCSERLKPTGGSNDILVPGTGTNCAFAKEENEATANAELVASKNLLSQFVFIYQSTY